MFYWLEVLRKGSFSLKSFLGVAEERESGKFERGINSKVKCRTFGKVVEFSDAGTKITLTYGINEELGRNRGREKWERV